MGSNHSSVSVKTALTHTKPQAGWLTVESHWSVRGLNYGISTVCGSGVSRIVRSGPEFRGSVNTQTVFPSVGGRITPATMTRTSLRTVTAVWVLVTIQLCTACVTGRLASCMLSLSVCIQSHYCCCETTNRPGRVLSMLLHTAHPSGADTRGVVVGISANTQVGLSRKTGCQELCILFHITHSTSAVHNTNSNPCSTVYSLTGL